MVVITRGEFQDRYTMRRWWFIPALD